MFVFRKVTVDANGCKTILYCVLHAICINKKWPTNGKYINIVILFQSHFSQRFLIKICFARIHLSNI